MDYIYRIAGLEIACRLPFDMEIRAESEEFLDLGTAKGDLRFVAEAVDQLPEPEGLQIGGRYYSGDQTWFCAAKDLPPYAMTQHFPQEIRCFYLREQAHRLHYSFNLCDLLSLERILPLHEALLLHCAFIRVNGEAILFSGASGVGKSTQADLWCTYRDAKLINGDRPILSGEDSGWLAWGSPYAGSSRCHVNACCPVTAIVMLRQEKKCTLRRLGLSDAFRAVWSGLTISSWNEKLMEKAVDLSMQLINSVPVFEFGCTPDEQAVIYLEKELQKHGTNQISQSFSR